MEYSIGTEADAWNAVAVDAKPRSFVEREYERLITRHLLPTLSGTEFKVLSLIKSRTLGWQKYAEVIPVRHFIEGILGRDGELMLDYNKNRVCSGAGIAKEETVQRAVKTLRQRELITVFPGRPGGVAANVYLPMGKDALAELIVQGEGVLPSCYTKLLVGEHVIDQGCRVFKITRVVHREAFLAPVKKYGDAREESEVLPFDEIRRFEVETWIEFKKRRSAA